MKRLHYPEKCPVCGSTDIKGIMLPGWCDKCQKVTRKLEEEHDGKE